MKSRHFRYLPDLQWSTPVKMLTLAREMMPFFLRTRRLDIGRLERKPAENLEIIREVLYLSVRDVLDKLKKKEQMYYGFNKGESKIKDNVLKKCWWCYALSIHIHINTNPTENSSDVNWLVFRAYTSIVYVICLDRDSNHDRTLVHEEVVIIDFVHIFHIAIDFSCPLC